MRRTYRALAAALLLTVVAPASVAYAGPEHDAAEESQTIQVAWLMPGPYRGYATFPQTYLPGGVPACGEGGVQVDVYKYGTPEVRAIVDNLLAGGVLTGPADDARVALSPRVHWFVGLTPCGDPVDPGQPVDPGDPGDPVDPGGPTDLPSSLPARPLVAQPGYAG